MGNLNCKDIVEENLLQGNMMYRFRWSISILVAIVLTAMCHNLKLPGYISGLFIPLGSVFLVEKVLEYIAKQNLDRSQVVKMVTTCDEEISNIEQKIQGAVANLPDKVHADNIIIERFSCPYTTGGDNDDEETFENFRNEDKLVDNLTDKQASANIVPNNIGCMMPSDPCMSLCSGSGQNSCNVVAPIPGPQWQPQSASVVQARLQNGAYVPTSCLK